LPSLANATMGSMYRGDAQNWKGKAYQA